MFYNLLTDAEREKLNAEKERLLQELLADEYYSQKYSPKRGYYKNILDYFSHKEEMVKLHNLIKSLCLKVGSSVENSLGYRSVAEPKIIAVGSSVDFSDISSVAAELYRFGDGVRGGRYEFDKYPEAEKIHELWQKL